ncbi:hypothetical protein AtNW77_Chr4g0274151 [Arabidopsis thaliana]|jgi:hypothetical protein|uniref:At4g02040 n=3 Tax=Arabidopsis TaxID=3701 RepID=O04248_ARATH|nr:uncharacterized protein AT4G02040 [Arabidopsis thaliana]KAG7614832.1 hypothetical protein ISN45_At04g002420 [Arabidopsis thaliana x Arabidopsis arenosa]AAC78696.1 hypothetical protein [Arabidopsis thaliana]ABD57515.1 At4g02040 [Arabidopsis thaliana]AEE82115.1 hypothetical protein AT4G02040 [Arabidopsis thaliana]OAO97917.1 hypothetical protein AXX17_AT4G02590 [Arabidopsis thaliana]|eukprot:NP_192113.1 hypothetical protein AT4G02040 [Arabidopsis thaliana]
MATAMSYSSQNHRFEHQTLIHRNPKPRLCRNSSTAPRRRKQSPTVVKSPAANPNLVMEQVKILKRGETLSAFNKNKENISSDDTRRPVLKMIKDVDLIVSATNRIGPEPEILMKQIGALGLQSFAGANCSLSPPPSCVPIPCFLGTKNNLLV